MTSMIVPSVFYAPESWVLNAWERRRVKVFDKKCLRRALRSSVMEGLRSRIYEKEVEIGLVCWNEWTRAF